MIVKSNNGKTIFDIREDGSLPTWTYGNSKDSPATCTGSIQKWENFWNKEAFEGCDRCGCLQTNHYTCPWRVFTYLFTCKDCDLFNKLGFCESLFMEAEPDDACCCKFKKYGIDLVDEHETEILSKRSEV